MQACVYKSTGSWYSVKGDDGRMYNARIRGKLKISDITSTNPIAVGDRVEIESEESEGNMVIAGVCKRDNYINRVSPHNKTQHHIVAANVDQSLLFATLKSPRTSLGFIDRFLITSEAYHVPAIVVLNKTDIYGKKEQEALKEIKAIYESVGYPILEMSISENVGVDEVISLLRGKTTLLSGHSGVGKSSFINKILPDLTLKTQDVSGWSGKGMHTTTFAEMFDLPFGGRIIDTPGIREMGLVDISRQELSHYFPEMRNILQQCQFNNCLHIEEPGCAIKKALESGSIHAERYASYVTILDSIEEKKY
jgi:ribosome biogenesis GTPase